MTLKVALNVLCKGFAILDARPQSTYGSSLDYFGLGIGHQYRPGKACTWDRSVLNINVSVTGGEH